MHSGAVQCIRVPARYEIDDTGTRIAVAEFKLGVGPCGKNVTGLTFWSNEIGLWIGQTHRDGSIAEFFYLFAHITGRIEVTYAG